MGILTNVFRQNFTQVFRNVFDIFGEGGRDLYAENGFSPPLVIDPVNSYYRVNGSTSTFDEAVTYTGDSHKMFTDSDGLLKYAAHNLSNWSEDISNVAWISKTAQ